MAPKAEPEARLAELNWVEEAEAALLEPELEPELEAEALPAEEPAEEPAPELEPAALVAELMGVEEATEVERKLEARVPFWGATKLFEAVAEVPLETEPEEAPVEEAPVEEAAEAEPEEEPTALPEMLLADFSEPMPEAPEETPVAEEAAAELELELVELADLQLRSNRGVVLETLSVTPKLGLAPESLRMYHQVLVLPSRGQATWSQYFLALAREATA